MTTTDEIVPFAVLFEAERPVGPLRSTSMINPDTETWNKSTEDRDT